MTNWQKTLDKNILDWREVTAAELPTHLHEWLQKAGGEQRDKKLDILAPDQSEIFWDETRSLKVFSNLNTRMWI